MKNQNKLFKWLMLGLIVISVVLLIVGFIAGFESNDGKMTDVLLYWGYVMIGLTIIATVVFGLWISIKNNPKTLVKLGIGLAGVAVVCLVAYLLAPGKPAMGMLVQPDGATLKLTDTILNLTYFAGAAAIIAIIVGEVRLAITNKKK